MWPWIIGGGLLLYFVTRKPAAVAPSVLPPSGSALATAVQKAATFNAAAVDSPPPETELDPSTIPDDIYNAMTGLIPQGFAFTNVGKTKAGEVYFAWEHSAGSGSVLWKSEYDARTALANMVAKQDRSLFT